MSTVEKPEAPPRIGASPSAWDLTQPGRKAVPEPAEPPRPEPTPLPPLPPLEDFSYSGPSDRPAVEASPAALELLAGLDGLALTGAWCGAIAALDASIAARRVALAEDPMAAIEAIDDAMDRRRVYAANAEGLARLRGVAVDIPPAPPPLPDLARLLGLAAMDLRELGPESDRFWRAAESDRREAEAEIEAELRALASPDHHHLRRVAQGEPVRLAEERELAITLNRLVRQHERLGGGASPPLNSRTIPVIAASIGLKLSGLPMRAYRPRWFADAVTERLNAMTSRRDAATGAVTVLARERAMALELVRSKVARAIEAAGGADAVAGMVSDARRLAGEVPAEIEADAAELGRSREELLATEGRLKLVDPGPAHRTIEARIGQLATEVEEVSARIVRRHRELGDVLVRSALDGAEAGRLELERLASACPDAFEPGFAPAIGGCRFDRVVLLTLASAAEEKGGEPADGVPAGSPRPKRIRRE
jgi:hypothetical protein